MQKTKLGISVGLLAAAIYFTGIFDGYLSAGGTLIAILLTFYVLFAEDNVWLRKSAVKAVALMIFFILISVLIGLIPNFVSFITDIADIFQREIDTSKLTSFISAIQEVIDIVRKVLFTMLGFKALGQGTISIPVVDNLIDRYM